MFNETKQFESINSNKINKLLNQRKIPFTNQKIIIPYYIFQAEDFFAVSQKRSNAHKYQPFLSIPNTLYLAKIHSEISIRTSFEKTIQTRIVNVTTLFQEKCIL